MATQSPAITGPITALVEYQIRSENCTREQWLNTWAPRAADALDAETGTTAYETAIHQNEDRQVMLFERYTEGQTSLDAHMARPSHQALMDVMGKARMIKRRIMSNLFQDIPDYGWWSRPERTPVLREAGLSMTLIVTRFDAAATRHRYIELTGDHARYCWHHEPDTLVYSGGLALRDSDREPQIKTGDLLFIAVFANDSAAAKHRDDPQHIALQPKLAELDRERILVQRYNTSGKGFLWAQRE